MNAKIKVLPLKAYFGILVFPRFEVSQLLFFE